MSVNLILPILRFPEFKGSWKEKKLSEVIKKAVESVTVMDDVNYRQIGIRSHGKGIFHKTAVTGKSLGSKRVFWVKPNALIVNIVFAWEHAIAITSQEEIGMIASHRFPMYLPIDGQSDVNFLLHFFLTKRGKSFLELASPGGAGRNKTLGQKEFENLKLILPEVNEQEKIAEFLTAVNRRIEQLNLQRDLLEKYRSGCRQKIFNQILRFKDEGKEYPDWQETSLDKVLDYIQPTNYIVNSVDYDNAHSTPVLTAGKTFILGYTDETGGIFSEKLPVIIFDDFTTANKFVNFPFKIKSSAIKILVKKASGVNMRFVYEAIQFIDFPTGDEHKRYWISEYSKQMISLPCPAEQNKIADFLSKIEEEIKLIRKLIAQTEEFKNGLVSRLFA